MELHCWNHPSCPARETLLGGEQPGERDLNILSTKVNEELTQALQIPASNHSKLSLSSVL